MKINCELPNDMLSVNAYLNEYDFVLFHLYSTDKTYREYYQGMRKYRPGRLMILDNSAYEFFIKGDELDVKGYMTAIQELQPDMFLLPDVLMNRKETILGSQSFILKWKSQVKGCPSQPMAVLQGNTAAELIECAKEYKEMGIDRIAIPFHNSFFIDHSRIESEENNHLRNEWRAITGKISRDDEYALGRVMFVRDNQETLSKFQHVHLLGSHNPLEKRFEKEFGFVKTMDTGYPVKCAIAGHRLGEESSKPNIIIDDFLNKQLSDETRHLITENVELFKQY